MLSIVAGFGSLKVRRENPWETLLNMSKHMVSQAPEAAHLLKGVDQTFVRVTENKQRRRGNEGWHAYLHGQ